ELEIRAPLLLAAQPSKRVRTTLDAADGSLRIVARDIGSAEPWTLHATARILREAGPALLAEPALECPARAPDFTASSHALLTQAVGLEYGPRSEEHTSELQSRENLVCRLLLE